MTIYAFIGIVVALFLRKRDEMAIRNAYKNPSSSLFEWYLIRMVTVTALWPLALPIMALWWLLERIYRLFTRKPKP